MILLWSSAAPAAERHFARLWLISYAAVRLYGNSSYHTEKAGNFLNHGTLVMLAKLRRGML
jgi:hypothetical protein